ncbi:MAG: hypothetical protein BYD32DRAFT_77782 [Podila humilis]|nr:MAG: hypothetical protein BYD32DRAFT_77782 [Podila humilis]
MNMKSLKLPIFAAFLTLQVFCSAGRCDEGKLACMENCTRVCTGNGAVGCWAGCSTDCARRCDPNRGGCHKGYCWAGCVAVSPFGGEWCYTTKGYSQDYQYVKCSSADECNSNWKCAGPCALF